MSRQGFLIQASVRLGTARSRPALQLYGRLAEGQTFLVSEDREVPYFFIRTADVGPAAALLTEAGVVPTTRRNLAGEPVSRVQLAAPPEMPALSHRLSAAGIATYEADLNGVMRYLIDRGVRGSLEIHGASRPGHAEGVDLVFHNPEVSPGSGVPRLSVLALRLAFAANGHLRAAAIYGSAGGGSAGGGSAGGGPAGGGPAGGGPTGGTVLRLAEAAAADGTTTFADERTLLTALGEQVRRSDPDVLLGWEVVPAELAPLKAAAQRARVPLRLGRGPGNVQVMLGQSRGRGGPARAVVTGRMVLDAAALVKLVAPQVSDESLEVVAARVLGARAPTAAASASSPATAQLLAEAQAVYELTAALQLIELTAQRSRLCGLPLDRIHASVAAFDYLYLLELGRRGFVAPTFARPSEPGEAVVGGLIIAPLPGVYRNVLVLDFRSLYPSLIRTFQIDPLGLLPSDADAAPELFAPDPEGPIVAPSGARFRRQLGVLTVILDQIFPMRAAAKAEGDAAASQAIKLLMNSLYGVLGSPGCRFHRPELANAVTSFGRELLQWTRTRVESYGYRVVYGDTDSLFVESGQHGDSPAAAVALRTRGEALAARLTADLGEHVRRTWGVESRLVLQMQTVYLRLLMTPLRRSRTATPSISLDGVATIAGAAKRYAGLCAEGAKGDRRRLVFVGMEAVRRDATELCKAAQRELHELLFADRPAADLTNYLHRLIRDLGQGKLDAQLVYHKLLRKDPADYNGRLLPHVVVAQRLGLPAGRLVHYVITKSGPEPAAPRTSPLDYAHYLDKQLRPAAEPVLALYGLSFDQLIGKERQLKLF